ncbi:MAG: GTP-sensing pleiotropic transcriptional regulator CodY [Armatimonadetes bacterium]|nr:GTP-sensing pleiotropic transcriptional regulator CodY [Armatimonadota bacterium]MDW8152951.1 GTP-sensing pleiotropic transcriptional regulator CodY [Armatimonadota bacterium]
MKDVLLESARRIAQAIGREIGRTSAQEVLAILGDATRSAAVLLDAEGKVVATWGPLPRPLEVEAGLPPAAVQALERLTEPAANLRSGPLLEALEGGGKALLAFPLQASGRRVGSLLLLRKEAFQPEEEGLVQYGAAVLALHMLVMESRALLEPQAAEQVRTALGALSYSELEAIRHILQELGDAEGIVVASRVADRAGITRSVIVNALRKLESARVIQSRSLGMKGTYIKILNPLLREELERGRTGR